MRRTIKINCQTILEKGPLHQNK